MKLNWIEIGKAAAATTAIIILGGSLWQAASWLEINPVLSMELKRVERSVLENDIPLLIARQRSLRITRGQLKILPQTNDTVEDIEAYNDEIKIYDELITGSKKRQKEIK